MKRALVVLALLCAVPARAAPEELQTPRNVMGGMLMLLAISSACGIELSPEERAALLNAGERMRQASGLSTEDIAKLGPAYQRTAERSCADDAIRYHEVVRRLLNQADRVWAGRARP